jgi:hypothetical protein
MPAYRHALTQLYFYVGVCSTGLNYLLSSCLHQFATGTFLPATYVGLRLSSQKASLPVVHANIP